MILNSDTDRECKECFTATLIVAYIKQKKKQKHDQITLSKMK